MQHIVLFSGGLDSLCTVLELQRQGIEPTLLYVAMGVAGQDREVVTALRLATMLNLKLHVSEIEDFGKQYGVMIPMRNVHLALAASRYLGEEGGCIYMGGLADDHVADKTPRAFQAITAMLQECGSPGHSVDSVLWKVTKAGIVAAEMAVEPEWFLELAYHSESCYHPTSSSCGECDSCIRKWVALAANGVGCRDWFLSDPQSTKGFRDMVERVTVQNGYHPDRVASLQKVSAYEIGSVL